MQRFVKMFDTSSEPLGNGQFWGTTTCEGGSKVNSTTKSVFIVQAPLNKCDCKTTFTYREATSKGTICNTPVFTEIMTIRNEDRKCSALFFQRLEISLLVIGREFKVRIRGEWIQYTNVS
jgi:hypothetical protein